MGFLLIAIIVKKISVRTVYLEYNVLITTVMKWYAVGVQRLVLFAKNVNVRIVCSIVNTVKEYAALIVHLIMVPVKALVVQRHIVQIVMMAKNAMSSLVRNVIPFIAQVAELKK